MTSLNPTNTANRFNNVTGNSQATGASQPQTAQAPKQDAAPPKESSPGKSLDETLRQQEGRRDQASANTVKGRPKQATAGYNQKVSTVLHQNHANRMAKVASTTKTTQVSAMAKETKDSVELTLGNGRKYTLPKESTWWGSNYAYTSVVNRNGKARYTGKLSPEIDKSMQKFLGNMDNAIKAQEKKLTAIKAKGSWTNYWSGEQKNAQAQLDNLKKLKHFGMRFFYDLQVSNAGKGKPVLAQYQAGGKGFDGKGAVEHPETLKGIQTIFNRSNAAVIKEVQSSKEFYRGMAGG